MAFSIVKNGDGLGRERLVVWDGVGSLPTTYKGAAIDADMPAIDSSSPGDRYMFDGTQWVQTAFGGASLSEIKAFAPAASTGNTVTSTLAALASFATENISKLGIQLKVETAALDQLDLYVKYNADGDYIDLGIGVDWSSAGYPVLKSGITNDASIAVGDHYIILDVSAFYSVQLWAASATTSTVGVYAGGVNG